MSLSCYFDFEAEEKFQVRVRGFKTPSNTQWYMKEEWMVNSNPEANNLCKDEKAYFHQISMYSEETDRYSGEVVISNTNPDCMSKRIVRRTGFNQSFRSKIAFADYRNVFFTGTLPIMLRCTINLFPLFHAGYVRPTRLSSVYNEVPFAKVDTEEAVKNLSRDMKSLMKNSFSSDISLICGSTEVKVHKNILAVRAPVFAWMYGIPMEESEESKVSILDMDPNVLKEILSFIYTGKVSLVDRSIVNRLCVAAENYDMTELKNICSSFLEKH